MSGVTNPGYGVRTLFWENTNLPNAADTNYVTTTAYTLPAGAMGSDGDELLIEGLIQTSAATSSRTYTLNIGFTAFTAAGGFTGGTNISSNTNSTASLLIEYKARIIRTAATGANSYAFNQLSSGGLQGSATTVTGSTIDWSAPQSIALIARDGTGNAAAITIKDIRITHKPR